MKLPEPDDVKALIEFKKCDVELHDAFAVLSNVRSENVWLANFASQNTRDAYQRSVASFVATIGISTPDDLYAVKQAHVLAWRAAMDAAGLSQATIANRLSALSSLYKHLTDQQLTTSNPVAGVRRPSADLHATQCDRNRCSASLVCGRRQSQCPPRPDGATPG